MQNSKQFTREKMRNAISNVVAICEQSFKFYELLRIRD